MLAPIWPAALRTAAIRRARRKPLVTVHIPPRDGTVTLQAKALKVTLVLNVAAVAAITLPQGASAPPFVIEVGGRRVRAQVSAKNLRKALATIAEHGVDETVVILQGKLAAGDEIVEAGFVATVRKSKAAEADAA